jgi:hypothetical protein
MTADSVNSLANVFLIASLVVGVIATYAIVVSGNIKEKKLKQELAATNERAAEANQKAAELNIRAASLEKEAAAARLETERLKAQFAWRRLNEKQVTIIAAGLSKVDLKEVSLSAITSDPESMTFANDIKLALTKGGIKVTFSPSLIFGKKPTVGIRITASTKDTLESIAQPFVDAGLILDGVIKAEQKDVNILIGSKPHPAANNEKQR